MITIVLIMFSFVNATAMINNNSNAQAFHLFKSLPVQLQDQMPLYLMQVSSSSDQALVNLIHYGQTNKQTNVLLKKYFTHFDPYQGMLLQGLKDRFGIISPKMAVMLGESAIMNQSLQQSLNFKANYLTWATYAQKSDVVKLMCTWNGGETEVIQNACLSVPHIHFDKYIKTPTALKYYPDDYGRISVPVLFVAIDGGNEEIVKTLLSTKKVSTNQGYFSASDFAEKKGNKTIIELIEQSRMGQLS